MADHVEVPTGDVVAFLGQVGGLLDRDLCYPDKIDFVGQVTALGVPTPPANPINVREGFYFAIHTISGTYENPAAGPEGLELITWVIRGEGEGKAMFRNQGRLSRLCGIVGARPMELRCPYVVPSGGQMQVEFGVVAPAEWIVDVNAVKRISLILEGDNVRVDFMSHYLKAKFELYAKMAAIFERGMGPPPGSE